MSKINIFCLGGASEVGRSCVIIDDGESSVMFDSGIHPAYMGIGCLPIYDAYDISKVDLCLITHFHMDHSGALPYLVNRTRFKGRVFMTEATKSICYLLWNDYSRLEKCMNAIQRNKKRDVFSRKGKAYRGNNFEEEILKKNYLYSSDEEHKSEDDFIYSSADVLYDEADIDRTMDIIETLNFHQNLEHKNIKFTAYRAGHVLGACMFLVELNNIRFLYTGDYSREVDRHIPIAEIPPVDVHVLICEGTYGIRIHDDRREREVHFLEMVTKIVRNRGKVLLPVFALGRAQELLLILEEHWKNNSSLKNIPIFYISSMAIKSLSVYETFINLCGDYVKQIANKGKNPFSFKYVKYIKSLDDIMPYLYRDGYPCVVMAAPGMLQNGISKNVFNIIAPDKKNGVILTGYTVRGTLADELKREPDFITINDRVVRRRCSFDQISFSAHSDFNQTKSFIEKLRCPNVVLVHGDKYELNRLKGKLMEEKTYLAVFAPEILQKLTFNFEPNDQVVAVGKLAKEIKQINDLSEEISLRKSEITTEQKGENVITKKKNSGNKKDNKNILESRTQKKWKEIERFLKKKKKEPIDALVFSDSHKTPLLLYPEDMNEYTNVKCALIDQSINIDFPYRFHLLYDVLRTVYEDTYAKSENFILVRNIKIKYDKHNKMITINWFSSPINDLIADSINFLILEFLQTMSVKKKVVVTDVSDEKGLYEMICLFVEENYANMEKIPKKELRKYVQLQSQLQKKTSDKENDKKNDKEKGVTQKQIINKIETMEACFLYDEILLKYMEGETTCEDTEDEIDEILKFQARDKLNQIVTVFVDIGKREVISDSEYMLQKIKEILRNLEEAFFPMYF